MAATDKKYLDLTGLQSLVTKKALVVHPSPSATANSNLYKITIDANGHVTGTTVATGADITGKLTSGTDFKTINNVSIIGSGNISLADIGLSGAMHFKGVVEGSTLPATTNYSEGDVIILGGTGKEYVLALNGTGGAKNWNELGDESSHALKTITITGTDGLSGGGTLEANRTISHAVPSGASADTNAALYKIKTDKFGHVTSKTAVTATGSNGAHTHSVSGTASVPADTYVTSVSTKGYSWSINKGTDNANVASVATRGSTITYGSANVGTGISIWGLASSEGTLTTTAASAVSGGSTKDIAKVGTAVVYGTANCKSGTTTVATRASSQTTVGNANVGSTVDGFTSSYDSTNKRLTLTPTSVTQATSSSTKIYGCGDNATIQEAVAAPNTQTITPAVSNGTLKGSYTISSVTVPVAAAATTSFTPAASSSTTAVVCGSAVSVLKDTTTISVSNPTSGAQATLAYTSGKNSATSLTVSGTAASDGSHTHGI